MPSASEILSGLSLVANQWRDVAIAWHVALGLSVFAIVVGWRPSARIAAHALALPLLSVSVAAFAFGNAVNGLAFTTLSLTLSTRARRLASEPIGTSPPVVAGAAAALVAFGTGYPHFLEANHWTEYAYAAPLGLLPCPTLAALTGVSMLCGHFGSRGWGYTLATADLAYGAIGVFVLGVTLDYVLVAGALTAVALLEKSIQRRCCHGHPVDRAA